jgi:hypothetical protein
MGICDKLNMKCDHIIDDLPNNINYNRTNRFLSLIVVMSDMEKEIKSAMSMLHVIIKETEKKHNSI